MSKTYYGEFFTNKKSNRFQIESLQQLKGKKVKQITVTNYGISLIVELSNQKNQIVLLKNQEFQEIQTPINKDVFQIIANMNYNFFISNSNQLYVDGFGEIGELGLGSKNNSQGFQKLIWNEKMEEIEQMTCGKNHSLLLLKKGDLYVWGRGVEGQLGLGKQCILTKPTYNNFSEKLINLKNKNKIYEKENLKNQKITQDQYLEYLQSLKTETQEIKIKQINSNANHNFLLTDEGILFGWGSNIFGQLGLIQKKNHLIPKIIPIKEKIVQISTNQMHSLILNENGQVFSTGFNNYGQLGLGEQIKSISQFQQIIYEEENDQKLDRIKNIQTNKSSGMLVDINEKVFYFGKTFFEKKINYLPQQLNTKKFNLPNLQNFFLSNEQILMYSPIEFHQINPLISEYGKDIEFQIFGQAFGKYSEQQKIRLQLLTVKRINLEDEDSDQEEENSESLREKDFYYYENLIYQEEQNIYTFKVPEIILRYNNFCSFEAKLDISLDGHEWLNTDLVLNFYVSQYFKFTNQNLKIFNKSQQGEISFEIENYACLQLCQFKEIFVGFKYEDQIIKSKARLENNIVFAEILQPIVNKEKFRSQILFFPNEYHSINTNMFIDFYELEVFQILPNCNINQDSITHFLTGKGIFTTKNSLIKLKYQEKEIQLPLKVNQDKKIYFNLSYQEFFEDKSVQNEEEEQEQKRESLLLLQKYENPINEIYNIDLEISICGQFWIPIPGIILSNSIFQKILLVQPQKSQKIEDFKQQIFQQEPQLVINPELTLTKKEKIVKDFEKKILTQEQQMKQTILQKGNIIMIQGNGFLEECSIKIDFDEENSKEIKGFFRNNQEIIFEMPEITREEFEQQMKNINFC